MGGSSSSGSSVGAGERPPGFVPCGRRRERHRRRCRTSFRGCDLDHGRDLGQERRRQGRGRRGTSQHRSGGRRREGEIGRPGRRRRNHKPRPNHHGSGRQRGGDSNSGLDPLRMTGGSGVVPFTRRLRTPAPTRGWGPRGHRSPKLRDERHRHRDSEPGESYEGDPGGFPESVDVPEARIPGRRHFRGAEQGSSQDLVQLLAEGPDRGLAGDHLGVGVVLDRGGEVPGRERGAHAAAVGPHRAQLRRRATSPPGRTRRTTKPFRIWCGRIRVRGSAARCRTPRSAALRGRDSFRRGPKRSRAPRRAAAAQRGSRPGARSRERTEHAARSGPPPGTRRAKAGAAAPVGARTRRATPRTARRRANRRERTVRGASPPRRSSMGGSGWAARSRSS